MDSLSPIEIPVERKIRIGMMKPDTNNIISEESHKGPQPQRPQISNKYKRKQES